MLLLLPDAVAAQEPGETPDPTRPRVFEASITAGSEYTDNFFRSEKKPESNLRQTITPDLALKLTGPFHRAQLRYRPTGAYSTRLEEFDVFQQADASAAYDVTPYFTVSATDRFSQSDNPATIDPNTLQARRITATRNTATLELPYRTETWSVAPRGAWTLSSNESDTPTADERSRILTLGTDGSVTLVPWNTTIKAGAESIRSRSRIATDFSGQTYRGSVSRPFGPRFDLTLDGSLTLRQPDRGEDYMIRDAGAGVRYQVAETILLNGRVGYQDTDVTEQPGNQGLTYSLQGTYTRARFTVTTTSSLSIQETFTEAENVGTMRTQNLGATISYEATEGLKITGSGRWGSNEFLESKTDRKETTWNWSLQASYRVTRIVALTGAWDRTQRDSSQTGNSFAANTFRLDLSVEFR